MTLSAIHIREATLDDAPEIMRQRRLMFRDMGFTDEAALDAMHATSQPYILAGLNNGGYRGWLAVAPDGRVMGGGGVVLHDWLTHPLNLNPQRAYVLNVYVYPEFRRQGVARRLMAAIVEWCRGQGFPVIWLHASDEGRPLYESMGFEPTNEMKLMLSPNRQSGEMA
ncbi:MAG TPA: GNAT family N-acetyltransferase [Terriglobales bacterium]|nr:GNAT family N-acetyltransferase [Terriglobales bacterium]